MISNPRGASHIVTYVAAVLGLLSMISACGGTANSTSTGRLPSVSFRLDADWDSLEPAYSLTSGQALYAMYDRLVATKPDGTVVPYLATSWTVGAGTATFTIRHDATCSDGTHVTADLIAGWYQHIFDPAHVPSGAANFSGLLGPRPWTVSAADADHVTITVNSMKTTLPTVMAYPWFGIVCPAGLQATANFEQQSYGSGPYTLVSAKHGDSITLKRRPEWKWGSPDSEPSQLPDQLVMRVVTDDTTAANLVSTGGITIADVNGPDVQRLMANNTLHLVKGPFTESEIAIFNERPTSPTADPAVREALDTAIDRTAYAAARGDNFKPATSIAPSSWACYDPSTASLAPRPDLSKAKSILEGDGYSLANGVYTKNGAPLTIRVISQEVQGSGPSYVAAQWMALGVKVVSSQLPHSGWVQKALAGDFDVSLETAPDISAAIANILGPTLYPKGPNVFGVNNPDAFSALTMAFTGSTDAVRCNAWKQVQIDMAKQHDIVPLAEPVTLYFSHGIVFDSQGLNYSDLTTLRHA